VLSDLLSSIAVIVAAGVMWLTGWYYADPIVSAGIGLFILPRTWGLISEAVGILLEGTPSDVNMTAFEVHWTGCPASRMCTTCTGFGPWAAWNHGPFPRADF
jgi:Co/Zn/Cd efflux system component